MVELAQRLLCLLLPVLLVQKHPHALDPERLAQVLLDGGVNLCHIHLREELRSRGGAAHDGLSILPEQRDALVSVGALRILLDLPGLVGWVLLLILLRPSERLALVVGHDRRLDHGHEGEVHVRLGSRLVHMDVGAHYALLAHHLRHEVVHGLEEVSRVPVIALGLGDDPIRKRLGLGTYLNPRAQGSEPRLNPALELGSQVVDNAVPVDVVPLPD